MEFLHSNFPPVRPGGRSFTDAFYDMLPGTDSLDIAVVSGTLDRLRAIPAADVVERPRWIPVTERLPKDEKDVLACYGFRHDGKMGGMRFIQPLCYFRFNKEPHWQFEGTNGMEVTHWMPLPEQPKEDAT